MTYQLGSAMLDAVVLSIVAEEDSYGYMISQKIKTVVNVKESTLYPVLKKLQEAGYLTTYDQAFQGRNRRYYTITESGREKKAFFMEEWKKYRNDIDQILLGGVQSEQE